jgi:hypothetical protein
MMLLEKVIDSHPPSEFDADLEINIAFTGEEDKFYASPAVTGSNDPTAGSSSTQAWDLVPLLNSFTPTRRLARLPCFMVETLVPNKDFFARQSILEELDKSLLPSQNLTFSSEPEMQKHAVLCGLGGLGKTSIAIEFVFSRREKFDAVFWIRADEPSKLEHGETCTPQP